MGQFGEAEGVWNKQGLLIYSLCLNFGTCRMGLRVVPYSGCED